MSAIFGILQKDSGAICKSNVKNAMQVLSNWNPDYSGIWYDKEVCLGHHLLRTTRMYINDKLPFYDSESGCCITADARIDYREELANNLEEPWDAIKELSDTYLILKSYLKWGEDCTRYLFGDFSFAIWNSNERNLFCARDHFGCRPFFYYNSEKFFAFSTEIKALLEIKEIQTIIDESWIAEHSATVYSDRKKTAYSNILRLEPAHYAIIGQGDCKFSKYWDLELKYDFNNVKIEDAISGLRQRIIRAVEERMRTSFPIGIELSGGLDSSGIASIVAEKCREKSASFSAFSHSLSDKCKDKIYPFEDEMGYCKQVVEYAEISNHYCITGEDTGAFASLITSLNLLSGPSLHNYALMSTPLYETVKKSESKILLSGIGGDEGISSTTPGYFEELIKERKWGILKNELNNKLMHKKSYILIANFIVAVLRFFPYIFRLKRFFQFSRFFNQRCRYNSFAITNKYKQYYSLRTKFFAQLSQARGQSVRKRQYEAILGHRLVYRLENSYIIAQSYGIEYRYPFLDINLIEYYYSMPASFKYRNGIGRYAYRKAMEDLLPNNICWRQDKFSATIPGGYYRVFSDMSRFKSLILESSLYCEEHFFDYRKLLKMLDQLILKSKGKKLCYTQRIFLFYMSILFLQKWQREGSINIGIKC